MSQEAKFYEMDAVRLRFMPDGGPMEGILSVEFPEQEPFTQHLSLAKTRSRQQYAKAAAQHNGIDGELSEKLLIDLCSVRFEEVEAAQQTARGVAEEPEECPVEVGEEEVEALVGRPGVLDRFVEDAATIHGVVGEREPLKLLTLNAFGAQLALQPNGKPLGANVILTAEWGRGKNYLCDSVATLLPEEFYLGFESASAKSLYYQAQEDPKILANRWLYLNEAEAMDELVEMLRPLLSGGKASHLTVNQLDGQNAAQELRVEGPVTITIPTIRNRLDAQLQSRLLVADLPDYEGRVAGHSRAASKLLLPEYATEDYSPRIRAWRAALRSLTALRRVVFPLDHEGFCFDRDDVSTGARLWSNVLGLMCAHTMLERRNREEMMLPSGERAIVATPADYEAAYLVFKATCERSVQNISDTHRRILDGLYELTERDNKRHWNDQKQAWSQRAIERHTGVSQSSISAQKSFLVKSLKLVLEDHRGRLRLADDVEPSLWKSDDALDGFPRPDQVRRWWNGEDDPPDPEGRGERGQAPQRAEKRDGKGANGDRHLAGHRPEASGKHPAQDGAGRHDDRPEDNGDLPTPNRGGAAQERKSTPKVDLTGPAGGLRDRPEEVGEGDVEKRLGAGWETQPPDVLLAGVGWTRYEGLPTGGDPGSEDPFGEKSSSEIPRELWRDPVSREILNNAWIHDSDYAGFPWISTDGDLSALWSDHEDKEGLYRTGGLPDLRDPRERLADMLPTLLQVRRSFYDPKKDVEYGGDCYPRSKGRLYCERWEKNGEDEGLWFFVARKVGQHIPSEDVEFSVWLKVSDIEGLPEPDYSSPDDAFWGIYRPSVAQDTH